MSALENLMLTGSLLPGEAGQYHETIIEVIRTPDWLQALSHSEYTGTRISRCAFRRPRILSSMVLSTLAAK